MIKHRIEGATILNWDRFHDFFERTFGFPGYYGRNMDAWNDCMSDFCYENGMVSLHIDNADAWKMHHPESFDALVECGAFINWRSTRAGSDPLIVLSYYV